MLLLTERSQSTQCISVCCILGCVAHADPCSPPKTPTTGMWASKLDHEAMEEGGLVWWITFSCTSYRPGEEMAPRSTMGRRRFKTDALGDVLLGKLGSCHSCGCYFDNVTPTYTFLLSKYTTSWLRCFLISVASFQQGNRPDTAKTVQQHDGFKELTRPLHFPDLNTQ